jgi:tetratricopeptide (TPR) repeat protein
MGLFSRAMTRGKIVAIVAALGVGASLVPVGWATVSQLRDQRPMVSDQGGVPAAVLAAVKSRYLSNRDIAAGPDEVARHQPWATLKRYRATAKPFGDTPPAPLRELPGASALTRKLDDLLGQGQYEQAAPRVQQAMTAAPDNLALKYQWARILHGRGELEAARQALYRVGERAPGHAQTWIQMAIVLNDIQRQSVLPSDRRDELIRAALQAMDRAELLMGGVDHMVHLQRGIVLCFADRFEESEWDLWRAVEASPLDGNAYWDIAWLEAQRGDGAAAAQAMRFAARDPRLFAMRTCQQEVLCDPYFEPVLTDPDFLAWVHKLPRRCAVQEHVGGTVASIYNRLAYLLQRCGP